MKHLPCKLLNVLIATSFFLFKSEKNFCQAPTVQFSIDKNVSCQIGNVFHFTNQSVGNNLTYKWDFKDGTFSNDINPTKSYATPGFYAVTLIATQSNIDYYFSKQIVVAPEPVLVNIDIQKTFLGKSYTYISNSTITSGSMIYFWNFADSVNSSLINPTHTYKDSGYYNVELKATSDYGCVTQKSKFVKISFYDSATLIPTFSINKKSQCVENNLFVFTYTGDTTNISSIVWEFGDNTTDSSKTATKHYQNTGSYFVKLTIIRNGITYTNEKIVTVNSVSALFTSVLQLDSTTYSLFANDETNANTKQFNWNFGDGCTANTSKTLHTFYPGNYNIGLRVIDANGCVDSTTQNIVITKIPANNLQVAFSINDSFQCITSNYFVFTNTSTKDCNISYLWNFGDGTTANTYNATKTYTDTGFYKITLTIFAGNYFKKNEKYIQVTNAKYWTGKVDSNWLNPNNWMCGMPTKNDDIIIRANAVFMPVINSSNIESNNLQIEKYASLNLNNSTLNLYGSLTGKGLCNAATSKVNFVGNKLQTISGTVNTAKLIINNTNGVVVNATANDSIKVYQLLTLINGNFNTNNRVVLKSTATQTARLDKVNTAGNIGSLTGDVTVERYFQNKRAWRFYTMPFTANGNNYSINNTFQTQTNVTGPMGIGFDYSSPYYSLNAWSDANNAWDNVKNTYNYYTVSNSNNFSNIPYFIFVRGNKNVAEAWVSSDVTFSFSGKLQTGNQQQNFSGKKKGNYVFIGNPYASPVDLATVQAQSQGLSGNFYLWDPSLNTNGAYVTISNKGNGIWVTTPAAAQKDRYMQSCQAMLFQVADTAGFVRFTEDAKTDTNYVNVFGSANKKMDRLTINLYKINADSSKTLVDGAITLFNQNYSKAVDENDSKKILNPEENIGFINDTNILAIEARPYVAGEDSLHIYTSGLNDSLQYAIEIKADYFDTTVQQIALIDSSLKSSKDAFFNVSTWYYFNKQTGNVNYNNTRFSIVLRSTKLINGKVENFAVSKENKNAQLSWNVVTEQGVKEYQVQYSKDNKNFASIATQAPLNNNNTNNYAYVDELNGKIGKHYYRIKTIDINDIEQISKTEVIEFVAPIVINKNVFVYPNPTKNIFNLHFYSESNQWFTIQVIEAATGRLITTKNLHTSIGENIATINLAEFKTLANGMYMVKINGEEISLQSQQIFYNK